MLAKTARPMPGFCTASTPQVANDVRSIVSDYGSPNPALINVNVKKGTGAKVCTVSLKFSKTSPLCGLPAGAVELRADSFHTTPGRDLRSRPEARGGRPSPVSRRVRPRSYVVPQLANTKFDNGEIAAEEISEMFNRRKFCRRFVAVRSFVELVAAIGSTCQFR